MKNNKSMLIFHVLVALQYICGIGTITGVSVCMYACVSMWVYAHTLI